MALTGYALSLATLQQLHASGAVDGEGLKAVVENTLRMLEGYPDAVRLIRERFDPLGL
jgi:hypothetical protein